MLGTTYRAEDFIKNNKTVNQAIIDLLNSIRNFINKTYNAGYAQAKEDDEVEFEEKASEFCRNQGWKEVD